MARMLVTGATGTLGREVLAAAAGHDLYATSRNEKAEGDVHWRRCDLESGADIDDAVAGADVIVHCATQPTGGKDVTATANLLAAAQRAGVGHVVYISIVGIDRIPLPYYETKLRAEQLMAESPVGHTVLRATQFHDLIAQIFSVQRLLPVLLALRGVRFQPVDTRDVAARLVELAAAGPAGRVPDIGGPEIRDHADLAHAYRSWRGSRRAVVAVPLPGKIARGFRDGANLAPGNRVGVTRFEDYLRRS